MINHVNNATCWKSNGSFISHKYSWENNMASMLVVVYMVQLILHNVSPSGGSSHWVVTEDGRIQAQVQIQQLKLHSLVKPLHIITRCHLQRSWHWNSMTVQNKGAKIDHYLFYVSADIVRGGHENKSSLSCFVSIHVFRNNWLWRVKDFAADWAMYDIFQTWGALKGTLQIYFHIGILRYISWFWLFKSINLIISAP